MSNRFIFVVVALLATNFSANAYELGTHARLTYTAYEQSVLKNDSQLILELGIDLSDQNNPFGTKYYDVSGSEIKELTDSPFEYGIMNDKNNPTPVIPIGTDVRSLPGWLMRGAIREDDWTGINIPFICNVPAENPQDDEYPDPPDRPLNHFFNPINDTPLIIFFSPRGETAPNWALGGSDAFTIPISENTTRRNHFTLHDAFESMYRALTSQSMAGNTEIVPDGTGGVRNPVNENEVESTRKAYWATMFRSLGDVIHLIEDMAQPQHTRNDAHSGACWQWVQDKFIGHASIYELYINARATGGTFNILGTGNIPVDGLTYTGYNVPEFDDYASFFSTRHIETTSTSVMNRRGLADYSNRGFFSAGKNLGRNGYEFPSNIASSYTTEQSTEDWQGNPLPDGASVDVLRSNVTDSITSNSQSALLTTYGLWDQYLIQEGEEQAYTLTKKNYDDMADLLIPRAVSYSAGFINHFFRGRLKINNSVVQEGTSGRELKVIIENSSTTGSNTYNLNSGNLELYYDATDGFRKPMTMVSGGVVGEPGIISGNTKEILATVPADVNWQLPNPFVLVYRGNIGQEYGVAGIVFSTEKFYVSFYNNSGAGYVGKFDGFGNNYGTYLSGEVALATRDLAVYGGNRYVTGATDVYKNGALFPGSFTLSNGLGVNPTNLFVADFAYLKEDSLVRVFTHDGTEIRSFVSETLGWPYGSEQNISANETQICVTDGAYVELFDINGSRTRQLTGVPDVGAIWACESIGNRHYLFILNGGIGLIRIYDDEGLFIDEIPLGEGARKGFGIGASETHVYVPSFYENKVYIIARNLDSAGNEQYSLERILPMNGPSIYPFDIDVDMFDPSQ